PREKPAPGGEILPALSFGGSTSPKTIVNKSLNAQLFEAATQRAGRSRSTFVDSSASGTKNIGVHSCPFVVKIRRWLRQLIGERVPARRALSALPFCRVACSV